MTIPHLSPEDFLKARENWRLPQHENYLVMYSSLWHGFVTDPTLWLVPCDDHMVHRGDAVFEVAKCQNGRAYCLKEHMARMERSAAGIDLILPPEFKDLLQIASELMRLGGEKDIQLRFTISRGQGSFSTNPYDCPKSTLIVTSTKLKLPAEEKYQQGVTLHTVPFPAKTQDFATIKSCAYLHNVLVKKSAVDHGYDFGVSFDQEGFLTEGSTENVAVITKDGELVSPPWQRILQGTTLLRIMDKGREMVKEGLLSGVSNRDLTMSEAKAAKEVFVSSTTMDMMSVVKWDDTVIGNGTPGPLALELLKRIRKENSSANEYTTDLWNLA